MAMSRKHYIEVAKIIKANLEDEYQDGMHGIGAVGISSVARDLACMFRKDNPAFDRSRFYMACGLNESGYAV